MPVSVRLCLPWAANFFAKNFHALHLFTSHRPLHIHLHSELLRSTAGLACTRQSPARLPGTDREDWLCLGVRRAIEERPSGRAFLQHLALSGVEGPEHSHFFETLKSARRLGLVSEVSTGLAASLPPLPGDWWKGVPELADFEVFAGDGHFHAAAAHDPRDAQDGSKDAVGHFFSLDLRSHALGHLTAADQVTRRKEHDMHALKRLGIRALRQGAATGRKVLYGGIVPGLISANGTTGSTAAGSIS